MLSRSKKNTDRARPKTGAADTLITKDTRITGDIDFTGVLYVDGFVKGNIVCKEDSNSLVTIGMNGCVEGEVHVPHVVVMGKVRGDVHASEHVELQTDASVAGNVYYKLIEMMKGAKVSGQLVHEEPPVARPGQDRSAHDKSGKSGEGKNGNGKPGETGAIEPSAKN